MRTKAHGWLDLGWFALLIAFINLAVLLALRLALPIAAALGQIGVNIVTRLTGLLLVTMRVEFIARGVSALLPDTLDGGP